MLLDNIQITIHKRKPFKAHDINFFALGNDLNKSWAQIIIDTSEIFLISEILQCFWESR